MGEQRLLCPAIRTDWILSTSMLLLWQVESELPCWLSDPARCLASLLAPACGPCWLCQAKRHLGLQPFTFKKRCSGFDNKPFDNKPFVVA